MNRLISRGGRLADRDLFEFCEMSNVVDPIPNQCPTCSGMGETLEQLDDDRLPVALRCWRCKGKGVLMPKHLEAEWNAYRAKVVPAEAGQEQIRGTKIAFYGGAWAYNHMVMRGLSAGPESTPPDEKFLRDLHAEMIAFRDDVKAGRE